MTRRWQHSYLLTALLAVCFLGAAGALWRYYASQRAAIEEAAVRELTAIGDIETIQIENWRQERLGDGGEREQTQIVAWMAALQHEFGYHDALLVDRDGQTFVRLKERDQESRLRKAERAKLAVEAQEPTLSDIRIDRSGERLITLT